jgi:hypothetical protein
MPAAVWGPEDSHFGEGVTLATNVLKKRYSIVMSGGMHIADVRDVAAVLAAVMERGRGPRSYMTTGQYISLPELIRTLAELSGRRIRFVTFPRWFLAGFGRAADVVQRRLKRRLPWQGEGIWVMNCAAVGTTRGPETSSGTSRARCAKRSPTPSAGSSRSGTSPQAKPAGSRLRRHELKSRPTRRLRAH